MKKILFVIFVISGTLSSVSQDLNSYKYVIVPGEFDFLKEPNQHQLNELTKFLFERYGMEAYMEGEKLPNELNQNRCKALNADVESKSGLFSTKLEIILKDCNNQEVFRSKEGSSRIKNYKEAYHEALRDAFTSIEVMDYNYTKNNTSLTREKKPVVVENSLKEETVKGEVEEENTMQEQQVATTPKTETEVVKEAAMEKELLFVKGNTQYFLEESGNGYNFYQKGMAEPFAALIKSSSGSNFIYSSINNKGMANFDDAGNLIVEILNSADNSLETTTYMRQ